MGFTHADYVAMQARVSKPAPASKDAADRETGKDGLHAQIAAWCKAQWPRPLIIAARTDKRSTIAEGAHDMTVLLPHGCVLLVECKARGGKLSQAQNEWRAQCAMLGHTVHVVYNLQQFIKLTTTTA